ncbi:aspartate aminotransferase family protein [Neorickettsia sennetsu]|uniref:Acetylornithine aminotransferase n=1 Tax=Ehrlichia sennetsu (strain ATCC VR-367 / Miyayama) TaxID=222891 RepID=Q2GCS9_EHRS3|nr:aspartate aminotransferase family protein [Neorickettsia sennetsu]ABD45645.1 acetylornithine aminotransferase [Neorickettsia sennetsu str. Miyayama]
MSAVLGFSRKFPVKIVRAKGIYLFDSNGKQYCDFTSGIATVNFGHCNEYINKKISEQIHTLWHCSNLFSSEIQEQTATKLVNSTNFGDKVFFCSSGLEAIEAAVKFIKRYFYECGDTARTEILTLKNGFHGRSAAGISAGGTEEARRGFAPLVKGFTQIEANNVDKLKAKVSHNTAAVVLELIQSEGGIYEITNDYLENLQILREKFGFLLCFDEIQTGFGRIGQLFHYENLGVEPDLLTCAKGMGNGFPVGGCIVSKDIASVLPLGAHGGTYSGNALAMAAVDATLDLLNKEFLHNVTKMSEYLSSSLKEIAALLPDQITDIRGRGLLMGVEIAQNVDTWDLLLKCLKSGLALNRTSKKQVLRILPPLIVEKSNIDFAVEVLYKHLKS